MASNSFKACLAILMLIVAAASPSSALPVMNRIELAAQHLKHLGDLVFARSSNVAVQDVAKAYEAYVALYVMQTDLASVSANGGTEDNSAYEAIKGVLDAPSLDLLAELFFQPLHHARTVGANMEAEIRRLIEKMKRQLY